MTTTASTLQAQLEDNLSNNYTKAEGRKAIYEVDKVSGKRAVVVNVRVNGPVVKQHIIPVGYSQTSFECWDKAYAEAFAWAAKHDAE